MLLKFFCGKCGTETHVIFRQQRQYTVSLSLIGAMRDGLYTPCDGNTGCTRLAVAIHQPLNLMLGQTQRRGRITATPTFFNNSMNDGKAVKFFI